MTIPISIANPRVSYKVNVFVAFRYINALSWQSFKWDNGSTSSKLKPASKNEVPADPCHGIVLRHNH